MHESAIDRRRHGARESTAGARDDVVPFDNIRRRTAEHMVRSLATSAHVYTSVRVDFERVERVRRAHQAEWKAEEGFSLTYLPFITRAFCDVVHDYPHVNASVDGESLVVHHKHACRLVRPPFRHRHTVPAVPESWL